MNELSLQTRRHFSYAKSHRVAIASESNIAPATETIDAIIAHVLGISIDRIQDDLAYQSIPEWDSLRHVTLMIALETEFGIKINDQLIVQLHSVNAIRQFVQSRSTPHAASSDTEQRSTAPTPLHAVKPAGVMVHRGLEGVYFDRSTITHIDGERGTLEHRGYSIHDLVQEASFEETAWLLLHGELPSAEELANFQTTLRSQRALSSTVLDLIHTLAQAHPMEVLRTGISVLGAIASESPSESHSSMLHSGIRLIAQMPTLIAAHHAIRSGREPIAPQPHLSHAENFYYMLFGQAASPSAVRFIDQDLIVHADHGSNASTFTARIAIGCRSNLHAAITAAIATFSGSLHGGAAERVIELIDAVGSPENAEAYVQDCLHRNQPVMGFGHRVYRTEDPRVCHLREAARKLSLERNDTKGLAIVEAVVKAMEPYALHGVGPNVDLYAGLAYRLLGLPDDLAVPMFVAGRIAGWVAQALEQDSNNVLIRPRLHYVGAKHRQYRAGSASGRLAAQ